MAFERLEPFGDRVQQMMVAQLTATVVNALREKGKKAITIDDLLPRFVNDEEEPDWRTWKEQLKAMSGKSDKPGKKTRAEKTRLVRTGEA